MLKNEIKRRVNGEKYPTLKRIRVGKFLGVIAALPLFTSWLFLIAVPMMIPLIPSLWIKDKIWYIKEGMRLW